MLRFATIAFAGLSCILAGCTTAPSMLRATTILNSVSFGTSRKEVLTALGQDFTRTKSSLGYGGFWRPAELLTEDGLQARKHTLAVFQDHSHYVNVYPTNLLETLPPKTYYDYIIVGATFVGGSLEIYYDQNTNYLGCIGLIP